MYMPINGFCLSELYYRLNFEMGGFCLSAQEKYDVLQTYIKWKKQTANMNQRQASMKAFSEAVLLLRDGGKIALRKAFTAEQILTFIRNWKARGSLPPEEVRAKAEKDLMSKEAKLSSTSEGQGGGLIAADQLITLAEGLSEALIPSNDELHIGGDGLPHGYLDGLPRNENVQLTPVPGDVTVTETSPGNSNGSEQNVATETSNVASGGSATTSKKRTYSECMQAFFDVCVAGQMYYSAKYNRLVGARVNTQTQTDGGSGSIEPDGPVGETEENALDALDYNAYFADY
ncbi:hypothetical protein FOZ63_003408 [Perkinsus olseni]|uniref:Uncharacterized protein n=1 Tax=Perkinsus olseni TaxID=32597 RepID=A0A7J6Q630_PEROL|nr:hypothetical protein FOZ63_003408 [Perkinsus olseni]